MLATGKKRGEEEKPHLACIFCFKTSYLQTFIRQLHETAPCLARLTDSLPLDAPSLQHRGSVGTAVQHDAKLRRVIMASPTALHLQDQRRDATAVVCLSHRLGITDSTTTEILNSRLKAGDAHAIESTMAKMLPGVTGQDVILVDLVARTELNGLVGTTTGAFSAGRVAIRLSEADGPPILLKAQNLKPAYGGQHALMHAMTATQVAPRPLRGLAGAMEWASTTEAVDPDGGNVSLLQQVLSAAEVLQLHEAALACTTHGDGTARRGTDVSQHSVPELASDISHHAHDVRFSKEHVALYLHRDGYIQSRLPQLWAKLLDAMMHAKQPPSAHKWRDEAIPLHVRCIELHSYSAGGGLLQNGHRDHGSVLTMSVLLSDPGLFAGGEFVTWEERLPVANVLKKGDAVLLNSCRAHNVSQVVRGIRQSLVVELWTKAANVLDRLN